MEEGLSGPRRRRVPRVSVNFPVILTWDKKKIPCQACQISELGILLAPSQKELVGENVQLEFTTDSPSRFLSLSGIVIYAINSGIGIRFNAGPSEQQDLLRDYLQSPEGPAAQAFGIPCPICGGTGNKPSEQTGGSSNEEPCPNPLCQHGYVIVAVKDPEESSP